ncbi:MAG TPA: squalene/phytoene synthase family protein [Candidatus Dormibacteraeota bacterium]|nr:squalene/phytoene synthase family protein [Candidatus Dormibacteraeota bacterium]
MAEQCAAAPGVTASAPAERPPVAPTAGELRSAHRACAAEVKAAAANFYYAFRLLPEPKRSALHAVYRFCRAADDIADGPGSPAERRDQLRRFRTTLEETLAGDPPDPGWLVLWDAARAFRLDRSHLEAVIDGCAADCAPLVISTQADLERYCYGVAGAVGLLSAQIFGYRDGRVPGLAIQLGEAMQLTNIVRDLKEDAARGRCYLPADDLLRFGCEASDLELGLSGPRAGSYRRLMAFQVNRARTLFAQGSQLVGLVERDARGCPAALAALYRALLDEIEDRGFDVQTRRISLGRTQKLRLALGAWLGATLGR